MRLGNCDVIVTYCWNRVGYNILRSLAAHGLSVWVADTSKYNICSVSKYSKGAFTYPDPFTKEEEFIDTLLKKVKELKPKVLIPTHDESVIIMRHKDEFPTDLEIPYSNADLLHNIANKAWATEKAESCGIPTPHVYENWKDVKVFPCVFKTVIGNSAKTVFFPSNAEMLQDLVEQYRGYETLIEEKVDGTDYSVDCVRWDGFFKCSTYHALMTKTDGGGTTTQRVIVSVPELEKYAKLLLEAVDYKGVCGMDFRYDTETGRVAFIEVNARFTGGIATPISAGYDIPWVLYSLVTRGDYKAPIDIRVGTRTKWILGDIITLVGRLLSFKINKHDFKMALTFKGFDAFDDYRSDDRFAILGEMSYYLNKLIKNRKLNP